MSVTFRGVRVAGLFLLALLIAEPGAALVNSGGYARTSDVLEGQLVLFLAEDFDAGQVDEVYAVQTGPSTFVETDVSALRNADELVGRNVRLAGNDMGSVFVASYDFNSDEAASTAATTADSTATTSRKTAVILLNFSNDSSQPWTRASVTDTIFGASGSVSAYYREVSYGATAFGGDVLGWVTIPYDNTDCRYSDWGRAGLTKAGVDPAEYTHIVYAFPRTYDCGWSGLSTVGGKYSWINGAMTIRTVGHELAHSMGVHHASSLSCTANGSRVTFSSTCTRSEYGDPFSIMGLGTRHHNNWHRSQLGWLTEMQTITASGSYSVAPAELTEQPRLLRLPRGDGSYLYFEFRRPFGVYDNFGTSAAVVNGVTIRIAPEKTSRVQSQLLDMTPGTTSFDDAALAVGRSFTDPISGATITTTDVSSSEVTISVRLAGTKLAPSSPTPSPTATPTPKPSATPSPTPTPTPTPTATPKASPTASPTPSPSATPTPTPTPTPTTATSTTLTAPTNVRARRLERRTVRVRWEASLGTVARYRVYRNGDRIGTTTSLRFYDWVPRSVDRARYVIRAVDSRGNISPRSKAYILYM